MTAETPSLTGAKPDDQSTDPVRVLTPAAERALAEAEARRKTAEAAREPAAKELGGRNGPEPIRYGDWEVGGIVSDF